MCLLDFCILPEISSIRMVLPEPVLFPIPNLTVTKETIISDSFQKLIFEWNAVGIFRHVLLVSAWILWKNERKLPMSNTTSMIR